MTPPADSPQRPVLYVDDRKELIDLLMALRFADELMADRADRMIQRIGERAEAAGSEGLRAPDYCQRERGHAGAHESWGLTDVQGLCRAPVGSSWPYAALAAQPAESGE